MTDFVIAQDPADSPDVLWCRGRHYAESGRLFGYVVDEALPLGLDELTPPRGLVLIARAHGEAVGCDAVKLQHPHVAGIKHMWIAPYVRGRGLGTQLLETGLRG